jgi:hypothetical protein
MVCCEGAILFPSLSAWGSSPPGAPLLERAWMITGTIGLTCLCRDGCFGSFLDDCFYSPCSPTELARHTTQSLDHLLAADPIHHCQWNHHRPFTRPFSVILRILPLIGWTMISLVVLHQPRCLTRRAIPSVLSSPALIFRPTIRLLHFSTFSRIISAIL